MVQLNALLSAGRLTEHAKKRCENSSQCPKYGTAGEYGLYGFEVTT